MVKMLSTLVSYCGHNSFYSCQLLLSKFCLHWSVIVVKILSRLVSHSGQYSVYTGKLLWSKFCLHWSVIVVKSLSTLVSYSYSGQNSIHIGQLL